MKALVKYALGFGNMEIREVEKPSPKPNQVLIKVEKAGICGSDLHIYKSEIEIPILPGTTTGHEFSGTICALGENVSKNFKVGDRVVSETAFEYCEICDCCVEGYYNLCKQRKTIGYWQNGAFTNYIVANERSLHKLDDNISFTSGAMIEPLACVVHAIYDLCTIKPLDVVVVSGPGSIGLMAAQVAKSFGATVIVTGTKIDTQRLLLAKTLKADYTIDVEQESLQTLVDNVTNNKGADVILECSGSQKAIDAALNVIKRRGHFVQIGLPGKKIEFDIEKICFKEVRFCGSLASRKSSWKKAIELVSTKKVLLEPLVWHSFTISQWEQAFELFESKNCCKVFLNPEN